jgi:hypothetical protein
MIKVITKQYFTKPVTKPYSQNIACFLKLFYAAINSSALKRSSFVAACTDGFDTPFPWVNRLE